MARLEREEREEREEQMVVVRLGDELYGLDIRSVKEIIVWQPVTRIPQAPDFVEGIINLRGSVIPVIDLRRRFRLPAVDRGGQTRIVVVELGARAVGFVVDGVTEVLRVPGGQIEPPSVLHAGIDTAFIRGVAKTGDRLILLLDAQRILREDEREALSAAEQQVES